MRRTLLIPFLLLLSIGCEQTPVHEPEPTDLRVRFALQALATSPVYPEDNPRVRDRFSLGWRLFFDPILSGPMDVACATCHHPLLGMSDARATSLGVHATGLGPTREPLSANAEPLSANAEPMDRNSPAIINLGVLPAHNTATSLFWDGRANSLEDQALFPIRARDEMRGDAYTEAVAVDSVIARLRKIPLYRVYFERAFIAQKDSVARGQLASVITPSTLALALAAFQREIIAPNTRFDQFVRGNDYALTAAEKHGLTLFHTKAGCASCHAGAAFTDMNFYGQGVGTANDRGRGALDPSREHHFRTPSLRNLSRTAPYMHDGSIGTIDEVLAYYNAGTPANAELRRSIDHRFKPLGLTQGELNAIKQFLSTLEDDSWQDFAVPPSTVPSNLNVP